MSEEKTTFAMKCKILGDLWMQYRFEKQFEDFVLYNDLGLPLAFMASEDLVKPGTLAKDMINETFDLLLASLKIIDDGYESLDEVLFAVPDEE